MRPGNRRAIFTDEHELFRESVGGFVRREIWPRRQAIRQQRKIDRAIWASAGEQGLLGISVPEAYGGAGVSDFRFNAILQEELVPAGLAYGSAFQVHVDVVAPYLTQLTTEEQRRRWLPRFCSGELITAIGMSEPEAGSDLAGMRTAAVRAGEDWVLSGGKTFITNGTGADLVVTAARTPDDGKRSITLFAIEKGMAGFTCGRKLDKTGQPEADTAELFFDDVRVPPENVIGRVGEGFRAMMERLPVERLSSACSNVAHAAHALELTLGYVRQRRAFGRPVGSFQANRFKLAELVTVVDVTQAYVDQCLVEHVAGRLDPVATAKAKWWTAEVQNQVLDACVQLFGGYGYMQEYDVARAWSDARVTKIWAGSNEIMKEIIGRSLGLGDPPAAAGGGAA
jgi:alkylation response protein AidB-like acyl-CoA dehydrogenase